MKKKSILKREDKGKDRASPAGSLSLSGELEPRLTAMREINGFFWELQEGFRFKYAFGVSFTKLCLRLKRLMAV